MSEKLVSIIVPVYNMEAYLSQCIDSLINQTYSNLEIILINDGSSDKSSQICLDYKNKDSRIIYLDKENSGVSDTRNIGISLSKGEYIMFVDSDDWIDLRTIEILVKNIEDNDIIKFNWKEESAHGEWSSVDFSDYRITLSDEHIKKLPLNIIAPKLYFSQIVNIGKFAYITCAMYRSSAIKHIAFNTSMHFCEDANFFLKILGYNKKIKIVCLDEKLYYYRHNVNSCTKRYRANMEQESIIVCDEIKKTLSSFNQNELYLLFKADRYSALIANLSRKQRVTIKEIKAMCSNPYWNIKELKSYAKHLTFKRKFLFILSYYKLYILLKLVFIIT